MKIVYLSLALALTTTMTMTITIANAGDTFTGVITDTMCGAKPHSLMSKNMTDAECVKLCAKGPHQYALLDGTNVMKLSDQKATAKYPAQKVTVTGTYDGKTKTIRVASIEPADGE